jgi:hypothetical protein
LIKRLPKICFPSYNFNLPQIEGAEARGCGRTAAYQLGTDPGVGTFGWAKVSAARTDGVALTISE